MLLVGLTSSSILDTCIQKLNIPQEELIATPIKFSTVTLEYLTKMYEAPELTILPIVAIHNDVNDVENIKKYYTENGLLENGLIYGDTTQQLNENISKYISKKKPKLEKNLLKLENTQQKGIYLMNVFTFNGTFLYPFGKEYDAKCKNYRQRSSSGGNIVSYPRSYCSLMTVENHFMHTRVTHGDLKCVYDVVDIPYYTRDNGDKGERGGYRLRVVKPVEIKCVHPDVFNDILESDIEGMERKLISLTIPVVDINYKENRFIDFFDKLGLDFNHNKDDVSKTMFAIGDDYFVETVNSDISFSIHPKGSGNIIDDTNKKTGKAETEEAEEDEGITETNENDEIDDDDEYEDVVALQLKVDHPYGIAVISPFPYIPLIIGTVETLGATYKIKKKSKLSRKDKLAFKRATYKKIMKEIN
eukprot:GHVR01043152.1.p1 GENE.GHVR01043152.1~~GHVR01043152.1.p1  ORF type:complete len:416 (+),score=92.06 GHVR01043152.1:401-1648(+)